MVDRPGFMLYFDIRPALQRMNNEERGQWLAAVIDYAEFGVIPSELDNMAGMAFDMFRPRIDQDAKRYSDKVLQSKYAVYCREAQRREETPCSFDEWLNNQAISSDNERYPTTTTTANTNTNTNTTATTTTESNADKPLTRHKYGSYKNVLFTDEEYAKLQAEYPTDYSERIERLSEYIASTGKSYKSHLATIRSWARKDGTKAGTMPSYGGEENWSL